MKIFSVEAIIGVCLFSCVLQGSKQHPNFPSRKICSDNLLITDHLIGWTTQYVNRIDPGIPGSVTFYRFQKQFTKLHIFNMVQYQRILYLDTDVLVVGDISPLLLDVNTSFAAVRDWESGRIQDHINCGVFSISPNSTEFHRLNSLRVHKSDYRLHMAV